MFTRITLALLAAALTAACASPEDAARWADEEATIGASAEALECNYCEYEEYIPRQAEAPSDEALAEGSSAAAGDGSGDAAAADEARDEASDEASDDAAILEGSDGAEAVESHSIEVRVNRIDMA